MDLRVGRALAVASAIGIALPAALPASAVSLHMPGRRHKPLIAANEGAWIVHAGSSQDIFSNSNKQSQSMQAYVCTRGPGLAEPRVELQVVGRAPIDVQGCQSLYLLIGPGERLAIVNPNPIDVSGTYKLDLQAQLK
jgi:hypothetical protein